MNEPGDITGDCESGQNWLKTYGLIALGNLNAVQHVDLNTFVGGNLAISGTFESGSQLTTANFGSDLTRNSLEVAGTVVNGSVIKLLNFSGAF